MKKALMALVFVPFFSLSDQTSLYTNPNPQPDDLYNTTDGSPAQMQQSVYVANCLGFGRKSRSDCLPILIQSIHDTIDIEGNSNAVERRILDGPMINTDATDVTRRKQNWKLQIWRDGRNVWSTLRNRTTESFFIHSYEEEKKCDDDEVEAILGGEMYCFNSADLNMRDNCPDSMNDPSYILPPTSGSPTVCKRYDDGSSCQYDLDQSGTFLSLNFENECYDVPYIGYDDSSLTAPDPNEPICQDIGMSGNVTACVEDPLNVCSGTTCAEGCGEVAIGDSDPVFVCLSGDTDGDTIPDYIDPDLDGDGIRNDDDTDPDGDGVDNPVYPVFSGNGNGNGNGSGTPINVTGIENRLDGITDLIDLSGLSYEGKTDDDLETEMDSGLDSIIQELTDATDKTNLEMGGTELTTELDFVDTLFGKIPTASCANPVLHGQTIDFCSKAPTINLWLYWIVAFITTVAIFHEANATLRRQ